MTTRYIRESALRTYYMLLSAIITLLCSYYFPEQTIYILTTPLEQAHSLWSSSSTANQQPQHRLIATELTETFYAFAVAAAGLTVLTAPTTIIYQVWQFTKPGLYRYEKCALSRALALFFCLSIMNLVTTYFFILPAACKFFLSFEISSIQLHLEAKIYTYICLILKWLFLCYFTFQLPMAMAIAETRRRFVYPFLAILGGVAAPDIVSQILILFVVTVLYESSVFIVKAARRAAARRRPPIGRPSAGFASQSPPAHMACMRTRC